MPLGGGTTDTGGSAGASAVRASTGSATVGLIEATADTERDVIDPRAAAQPRAKNSPAIEHGDRRGAPRKVLGTESLVLLAWVRDDDRLRTREAVGERH